MTDIDTRLLQPTPTVLKVSGQAIVTKTGGKLALRCMASPREPRGCEGVRALRVANQLGNSQSRADVTGWKGSDNISDRSEKQQSC